MFFRERTTALAVRAAARTKAVAVLLLALGLPFALAACDSEEPSMPPHPLAAGTIVTINAYGYHYRSEAIRAEEGFVTWKTLWGNHEISIDKDYRGLMPVYGREHGRPVEYQFDAAEVDGLFPLQVGREVAFKGLEVDEATGAEIKVWTHMVVRETATIELSDESHPVFVIDISTERKTPEGKVSSQRTVWYSAELGLALKKEYRKGDDYYYVRVLSVERPGGDESDSPARRSLGTVTI